MQLEVSQLIGPIFARDVTRRSDDILVMKGRLDVGRKDPFRDREFSSTTAQKIWRRDGVYELILLYQMECLSKPKRPPDATLLCIRT